MVMMFVGGVVLMFDGFLILFLLYNIYGAGVFCSRPNTNRVTLLKVMEIYGFLRVGSIETIGESACGYRHVVMDYYNECVSRYNDVLKVELRTKKVLHGKQPQSGEDPIEARTVEAHEAAMLAIPSQTVRVQLLGQLNCDWVKQCCVRKEETPDHCTFGLYSSVLSV
jgi:hypothetical protein